MKKTLSKLTTNEKGFGLVIVLCLLAIGGLTLVPLLHQMFTGVSSGQIYRERMALSYAAGAGMEDGIWKTDNNGVPLDPYDYVTEYLYSLPEEINGKAVNVRVKQIWPLSGLESDVYGTTPAAPNLAITGGVVNYEGKFEVRISYYTPEELLEIDQVAVWLPPEFEYVNNSSGGITTDNPAESDWHGGKALKWDFYPPINFDDLPQPGEEDPLEGGMQPGTQYPAERMLTFNVTPTGQVANGSYSWVRTTNSSLYLSWDTSVTIYQIKSTASDDTTGKSATVDSYTYVSKGVNPDWIDTGATLFTGDYRAVGNTLMKDLDKDWSRETLLDESSANISDIPEDGEVVFAYLYWSGWRTQEEADTICTFKIEAWLEDMTVTLRPNAAGDDTNISYQYPDSGAHWEKVDEATSDNFSTYVYTSEAPPPPLDWYDTDWQYRKKITIDYNKVVADLTDFPVLISITDSDLRDHAKSNGSDIVFTASDGTTKLKREIESYDDSDGTLVAWVKTDLSGTSDTEIYIYYGNSGASETNDTDTWDDNFRAVWHLGEASGGAGAIKDSTQYLIHGTDVGSPTFGAVGAINSAIEFNGSTQYIEFGTDQLGLSGSAEMTIEVWLYWVDGQHYFSRGPHAYPFYDICSSTQLRPVLRTNETTGYPGYVTCGQDAWHHIVMRVDLAKSGSEFTSFYDGGADLTADLAGTGLNAQAGCEIRIAGTPAGGSGSWEGGVDEVRISNIERSDAWVLTGYNNQSDPSSFHNVGIEELTTGAYERDLYNVSDYSEAEKIINKVTVYFRFSGDQVGVDDYTGYARAAIKTNGTVYVGSTESTDNTTFVTESYQWTTNPDTGSPWTWDEIAALQVGVELAGTSTTQAYCTQVYAEVTYSYPTEFTITADKHWLVQNQSSTYAYSCFKDVTDLVKPIVPVGNATYTVGDVYGDTESQLSYAGWSLIIIYSSPSEQGHQFFLWEHMLFAGTGDSGTFTIEGFTAPADAEATLTCFVGEGDYWYDGDSLRFNGYYLSDATNPEDDVWNSTSSGLGGALIEGVDIDTFDVSSPIINPGDTSATLTYATAQDNWNLIYHILSFRSDQAVLTPRSTGILSWGSGGG